MIARAAAALRRLRCWPMYRGLVEDHAGVLIVRWKPDTTLTFVNRQYCRYHGKTPADLLGRRWLDNKPPATRAALAAYVNSLIERPRADCQENDMTLNGVARWIYWTNTPMFGRGGRLIGYQGVGIDITDSKLAKKAIAESEKKFRDLADASSDWFWEMDAELRFTWLSSGVKHWLGDNPELFYGKRRQHSVSGLDLESPHWRRHLETLAARRPFRDFVFRRRNGRGEEQWIRICGIPLFDERGNFAGYRGSGSNVTRLYKAERALKTGEAQFRALFNSTAIAIVMVDRAGTVRLLNPAAEQLFGYSNGELRDRPFDSLLHPDHRAENRRLHDALFDGGLQHSQTEKLFLSKTGRELCGRVTASLAPDGEAGDSFAIKMIQDVTEYKQASAERLDLQRRLLAASRAAGQAEIAAGVLHNVGNVLNSLNTACSVIDDRLRHSRLDGLHKVVELLDSQPDPGDFFANDPKAAKLPAYLKSLARRLDEERRDLRDETRNLSEHTEHIKRIILRQQAYAKPVGLYEPVRLADLVDEVLEMCIGRHHRIEVRRRYQTLPDIELDKHALLQILINLVNNAKQAVDGLPDARRWLHVSTAALDEGFVRLVISDGGVGISGEQLTRLFSFGFSTKPDGHGFGLHASANAAAELGGRISAHSDGLDLGASFVLDLPLHHARQAA